MNLEKEIKQSVSKFIPFSSVRHHDCDFHMIFISASNLSLAISKSQAEAKSFTISITEGWKFIRKLLEK